MTIEITKFGSKGLRLLMVLSMWVPALAVRAQDVSIDEGWALLSRYLYRDAAQVFAQAEGADERWRDLGLAASFLNEPPVTSGKIARAEELLAGVVSTGPEDEAALYASYLKARILHMHRDEPVVEIEKAYRSVIEKDPQGSVGQLAASHLALLLLYQRADLEVGERLLEAAALETVAVSEALPEVSLGYYRALADASLFYEQVTPHALGWLRKAHEIGSSDQLIQIGLSLQIAEVARALHEREIALQYYQEFLATAVPTDQRYYTAKMRMQELEENK